MKNLFFKRLSIILLTVLMSLVFVSAVAEEWVLVDNESIVVKIKEFGEDSMWGHTMKVYMENKTDKLLMYSIDSCAVNGVMNDPFWAKEVMAGSKANAEISWFDMKGNASDIGITQLDFDFRVSDSEDWMADALLDQSYTIYPKGESSVVLDEYSPSSSDITLFDDNNATMIITGFSDDEIWGYTANVYVNNKTDNPLMFSVENSTVNGFMCDPFWAAEVRANTSAYTSISWMQEDFEMNDITNVEEIVLAVRVYDSEDWMADAVIEQQFTITP